MADERDPKVSQRYRELGTEEPPRRLDEAILAAARREAETRPAPLVAPTGRRRWYFPLAAAAVIVLSVAVTWHMQLERPDPEGYVSSGPAPARDAVEEQKPKQREESRADSAPREKREVAPAAPMAGERAGTAQAPQAAMGRMASKPLAEEPPEKLLERIAELRKQGKHEEADQQLEAFRKRYPDYKLPEQVLRK